MRKVQGEAKMQGRVTKARGQQRVRTVQNEAARNIALLRIAGACVVGNQRGGPRRYERRARSMTRMRDADVVLIAGSYPGLIMKSLVGNKETVNSSENASSCGEEG